MGVIIVFYIGYISAGNSNTSEVNDDSIADNSTMSDNPAAYAISLLPDYYEDYYEDYVVMGEIFGRGTKVFHDRGYKKRLEEDRHGAIEEYSKAIERDPNDSFAYYWRGILKFALGDLKGACKDMKIASNLKYLITNHAANFFNDECIF